MFFFGFDLHTKTSEVCKISRKGRILQKISISRTPAGLGRTFRRRARFRIVTEVGGETRQISHPPISPA